jgi:hypothetical protein
MNPEVTNALESLGKDMLDHASDERQSREIFMNDALGLYLRSAQSTG